MKKDEIVIFIIINIILIALIFWAFLIATSPEAWYAGMHDSKHEGNNCKCHERLVAADKEDNK